MEIEKVKQLLASMLDEKRYFHSLSVADEAKRLAIKYGADSEKMYFAGLVHDITKNLSNEEQLKLLNKGGIMLTDAEKASPKVWHGISGSVYLKYNLNIIDDEILSAVRHHSTAKENMTLAEKIIYIADLTSLDRNYPDVDYLREIVNYNLDKAIIYALSFTIKDLAGKNLPIHPNTVKAYNYLLLNSEENI